MALVAAVGVCVPSPLLAQEAPGETLTARLGPQQTIRDLAEEYLGDPNLWQEILTASRLESITQVSAGIELRIPVNDISSANRALADSLTQIQLANLAGAQIFAPAEITRAIDLYDQARAERLRREWLRTRSLALESHAEASTALSISEEFRGRPAEALLSDRQGAVEGQRPEDITWRSLPIQTVLIEQERVRTLSDSTAQITFRDASRLRLNANATAVIQVMRADPLSREEAAKVSLIEGDFYVLLSADSARRTFDVEIPEVSATVQSGDFWVQADAGGARFTNYDTALVEISTATQTLTLGQNEGAVVPTGAASQGAVDLLAPAELLSPANGEAVYTPSARLVWAAKEGAAGFWLEIASDPQFDRMVASRFGLDQPVYDTDPLEPGVYYWRVADLDQFGLPGQRSEIRSFERSIDTTPPYLTIDGPAGGAIVREAAFTVTGHSEPGIALTLNDLPVAIAADGTYALALTLGEGDNLLRAVATDLAGNVTVKERSVALMSDRQSIVQFDPAIPTRGPGHFLSIEPVLSLAGTTTPLSGVEIRSGGSVRSSAVSEASGVFHVNVELRAPDEEFEIAVIAPSGFTTVEPFAASIDNEAPAVTLAAPLPRLTSAAELPFAGQTEADAFLTLNGELVELEDGAFSLGVPLKAGANAIELISADAVGNVRVDRWTVTLDQEAPQLVEASLEREAEGDRVRVYIDVAAADDSGLAAAAPFTLATASGPTSGYLRFNRATQTYSGSVSVAVADAAGARLTLVELRDDAGNTQTFDLN
ncbi:MAG: FecR domain-containing protein [Bauldia sp.]|nr:FecR domain-containing protein [Bauldia sp.]